MVRVSRWSVTYLRTSDGAGATHVGLKQPGFLSLTCFIPGLLRAMAYCWERNMYAHEMGATIFAVEREMPIVAAVECLVNSI